MANGRDYTGTGAVGLRQDQGDGAILDNPLYLLTRHPSQFVDTGTSVIEESKGYTDLGMGSRASKALVNGPQVNHLTEHVVRQRIALRNRLTNPTRPLLLLKSYHHL